MYLNLYLISMLTTSSSILCATSKKEECTVCREFIKKFDNGMKNTANKNFGGGDADWREKNLGSFEKSETRLLEILESVCDDVSPKSVCHAMVEEYEMEIELWWFKMHNSMAEFEKFLCFDKMKVCCPAGHYGKKCKECPGGAKNPCSGRGRCGGEGSQGGNGKCRCNEGYGGKICDQCSDGFQMSINSTCEAIPGYKPPPKGEARSKDGGKRMGFMESIMPLIQSNYHYSTLLTLIVIIIIRWIIRKRLRTPQT